MEKRHLVTKTSTKLLWSVWIKFWTQLNSTVPNSSSNELPGDQNHYNFKLLHLVPNGELIVSPKTQTLNFVLTKFQSSTPPFDMSTQYISIAAVHRLILASLRLLQRPKQLLLFWRRTLYLFGLVVVLLINFQFLMLKCLFESIQILLLYCFN